jgi:hypothetical protein
MHILKDERGYALLSVLLIIAVFMIIFLSFMGRAFNSVKQNQVVEKSSQSVALAEMGMTHFEAAVQNIYAANQQTISNTIKQTITNDRNKGIIKDSTEYINQGISLMKSAIKLGIDKEQASISIDGRTSSSFSKYSVDYYETTGEPKILLKIKGLENGKSTILSTVMTFSPTITGLNSTGTTSNTYTLPNFNRITQPGPSDPNYCKNPASIGICTNIYVEGPGTFNENNAISGKNIFSTGTLTFGGNANKTNGSNIHAGGNISIGKNMINAVGVTMEANGSASFGSNFTVDSTKLYFNGKLTVGGKLDLTNKSVVYVNGDVEIGSHLNMLDSESTLCVSGDLTYKKNGSKAGGIIVVKGKINGVKTTTTDQDFLQKCGTPATPVLNVQWGDKVLNQVNYEY